MEPHLELPKDLVTCVAFHGHLCPGLVYGYRVAKEAACLIDLGRAPDEEIVAVVETDSCAVDALQVLLGTTAGKGNLIIKNYGKNAYTILSRSARKAFRFSRQKGYRYSGDFPEEFMRLEEAISAGTATSRERQRQRRFKALDLVSSSFGALFHTTPVPFEMPAYAPMAPSEACSACGEMTMASRLIRSDAGEKCCIPCAERRFRA
jgi:formylmethanofuran dehydrogenase subunit E